MESISAALRLGLLGSQGAGLALLDDLVDERDEPWVFLAPRKLIGRVEALVDACTRIDGFTCCNLQVGLEMMVGGRSWTDGTTDHFWHAEEWFRMAAALLDGDDARATAIVWEQSALTCERHGDRLSLFDALVASGNNGAQRSDAPWMPVEIGVRPFAAELLREGRLLAALAGEIRAEVARRAPLEHLARRIAPLGDKPRAPLGDVELVLATLARETHLADLLGHLAAIERLVVT